MRTAARACPTEQAASGSVGMNLGMNLPTNCIAVCDE